MEVVLAVVLAVLIVVCFMAIASRAGYSWFWGLIALIPIVDLIALFVFAFNEWPIQRELARLRLEHEFPAMRNDAKACEQTGDIYGAISICERLVIQLGQHPDAAFAKQELARLRALT